MINKFHIFYRITKRLLGLYGIQVMSCCDLLKIEIYPQADHAPISFRIYSEYKWGGGGGDVFRTTVSKTLPKSVTISF